MKIIVEVKSGCVVGVWVDPEEKATKARVLDWDEVGVEDDLADMRDHANLIRELADMTDIL